MKIEKIDAVHCRVNTKDRLKLLNCLGYKEVIWIQGQYGKRPKETKKFFIDRNGYFFTGLLPRVEDYLERKGYVIEFVGRFRRLQSHKPNIKGIKFRSDQLDAIEDARRIQRGVIHFPTGSGKTVIAAGLISCFLPKKRVLFLCHTIDILTQTYQRFRGYGFPNIKILGGKHKDREGFLKGQVCLSTIQSFSSFNPKDYVDQYDIVIVDEAHHISSKGTQYGQVLQQMLAPVRVGLTATVPEKRESIFTVEGLIGPVIAKMTSEEAVNKKILAQVKLNLITVPKTSSVSGLRGFKVAYRDGIVRNRVRNKLIVQELERSINNGETTLVMIRELEHGENLMKMCRLFKVETIFLQGSDNSDIRRKVAEGFDKKKIKCVIASAIWKEGIDIPSLNHVINAFGGKGEIPTVQVAGRGTRTDKGRKSVVKMTDFLDPYRYLAEHTVRRIQIYRERGWL